MKSLLMAVVPVLITACATPPPPPITTHQEAEYDATFDEVWEAALDVLSEHQMLVENLERNEGLITTEWLPVTEDDCDCGTPAVFDVDRDRVGKFNVFVNEVDEGLIEVQLNTIWRAARYDMEGDYVGTSICSSKGTIEKGFQEALQAHLSEAKDESAGGEG